MDMKKMTFKEAVHTAIDEELAQNPSVLVLGEDIGTYGGSFGVMKGLQEKYGDDRVLETPVSEAALVGTAVGAAVSGLTPIVEIMFADFITLGMDALVNHAAKLHYLSKGTVNVPMTVRLPSGSGTGAGAQHTQNFESWFASVPGLKVVAPTTPAQAKGLLKAAIRDQNPVVFIENKELYNIPGMVPTDPDYVIDLETTHVERKGSDVTIVAWGPALYKTAKVLQILEKEGISAEVINPMTLYPMDMEPIYESVMKTSRLVIAHDGPKTGGVGAEIAAKVIESDCFNYLDAPIKRVAGLDTPVPFAENLEALMVPGVEDICDAVYEVTGMK